jgi:hypothetical protein
MTTFVALPPASTNRVYGASRYDLAAAELSFVLGAAVEPVRLGGLDYLSFDLDNLDVGVLSNLSGVHALFERHGDLLRPVEVTPLQRCDDDLVTIPRYAGKTNEHFTKLLVNVTLAAAGAWPRVLAGETVTLLDPVCGRGTTLGQAMVYGLDAWGIELDRKDVEAYQAFLLRWLRDHRVKHRSEVSRTTVPGFGRVERLHVGYGPGRTVDVVHADTTDAARHVRRRSIDVLVADLPYGVQHGSRTGAGLARSPGRLLAEALPGWVSLIRPGGALGLAWNLRTLDRAAVEEHLVVEGLVVRPERFEHVVDRSITRDLVVAVRP